MKLIFYAIELTMALAFLLLALVAAVGSKDYAQAAYLMAFAVYMQLLAAQNSPDK
jgi:hypothetical protein